MLKLFRWLLRLTIGLIAVLVLAAILVWYFAIRSLPDYNSSFQVSGVSAPVEIVRSTENVPHIFGSKDEDVFFALGVAHAQDRLFQMTVLRRAAQGRLSEIYGPTAFGLDDNARRLGLYDNAVASVGAQDAATLSALKAYSSGINEWISQINKGALGRGAPEFFLYSDQISYWQPADSIAILKLLAASASHSAEDEVLLARLSLMWPEHGPEILYPGGPRIPAYTEQFADTRFNLPDRSNQATRPDLRGFLRPGMGFGANGFAGSSERTAANGSLLANDLHAALTVPSLFYLARIELSSGGVIGATIPGIPAVLSGRNPEISWGLTPLAIDDADIYIEEIKPGDPESYLGASGWTGFQTRRDVIRVQDSENRVITLRETENGPVLNGNIPGLDDVIPAGHVASLRWSGSSAQDTTISALLRLMNSDNRSDAVEALTAVIAPAFAVTLADAKGVQRFDAGAVPVRQSEHPSNGKLPAPGWLANARWTETKSASVFMDAAQSDDGIVIATDENLSGPRRSRLNHLLDDREVHSRDSFIAAQIDIVSPAARSLLPVVGANLWYSDEPAAPGTPERQRQDALALLADWDGAMSEHLPEPLIYAAWMRELQARLIRDEIGPMTDDIDQLYPAFINAVFRNLNGASRWCDIVQSAPDEDCTTIARQALDRAILDLSASFGPQVESWRWGDRHEARQRHPALGQIAGLGWVMNFRQSVSGGEFTVARSGLLGRGDTPYEAVDGAGYRGVYDLADPDSSVFVISTGQSGHPFSRHYDDLAELWRRGEYIGMSLDPDLARAAAVGVTQLSPAN